jgi:hypothetical protein
MLCITTLIFRTRYFRSTSTEQGILICLTGQLRATLTPHSSHRQIGAFVSNECRHPVLLLAQNGRRSIGSCSEAIFLVICNPSINEL